MGGLVAFHMFRSMYIILEQNTKRAEGRGANRVRKNKNCLKS